jgi:hypothetical protein
MKWHNPLFPLLFNARSHDNIHNISTGSTSQWSLRMNWLTCTSLALRSLSQHCVPADAGRADVSPTDHDRLSNVNSYSMNNAAAGLLQGLVRCLSATGSFSYCANETKFEDSEAVPSESPGVPEALQFGQAGLRRRLIGLKFCHRYCDRLVLFLPHSLLPCYVPGLIY